MTKEISKTENRCQIGMHEGKICGRPLYRPLTHFKDDVPVCLMHSQDPDKDDAQFQLEFDRIVQAAGDEIADFTKFVFPGVDSNDREFRTEHREFKAKCFFSAATFARDGDFSDTTFAQEVDFREAVFKQEAFFYQTKFIKNVDFSLATFTLAADFYENTFERGANFNQAKFMDDASFVRVTLGQNSTEDRQERIMADFNYAIFTRFADFQGTKFLEANFGSTKFEQGSSFYEAVFSSYACFSNTVFTQLASFRGAIFEQTADFREATFLQVADFSKANFKGFAGFTFARFLAAVQFRETCLRNDRTDLPVVTFSLARFEKPEGVIFYRTYLGQALFHNCDVSCFVFSDVKWRERPNGKAKVFEEDVDVRYESVHDLRPAESSADERNYRLIAELYQQLEKNYDNRGDYWTAGAFHYGDMETKRLTSPRRNRALRFLHQHVGLVALYKYASEYGESYARPALLLFVFLGVFTILFPIAGLQMNQSQLQAVQPFTAASSQSGKEPPSSTPQLSYAHFGEFVAAHSGSTIAAGAAFFGNSLMTALSVAGFQKELKYEPSYPWGRALALVELLLTSTMIALFLLAVRRQFKR